MPFTSEADCFRDTPDYASWLDSVPAIFNGQELPKERLEQAVPDYASDKQAGLSSRSALLWVEQLPADLPVLALQGDADDRVSDSRAIAERLKELGRPHKLVVYPVDNHGLQQNRMVARQEILDWFSQHTK